MKNIMSPLAPILLKSHLSLVPDYWNITACKIWRISITGRMWVTLGHKYVMIWLIKVWPFSINLIAL